MTNTTTYETRCEHDQVIERGTIADNGDILDMVEYECETCVADAYDPDQDDDDYERGIREHGYGR